MKTLYKRAANGTIQFWSIDTDGEQIIIKFGKLGGQTQTVNEDVPYGKGGRDLADQIESRINSRIKRKLDMGYLDTLDKVKAQKKVLNQLGLPLPMLAQKIKDVKNIDYRNSFIQYKYDGHRCLITKRDGKMIAYSRAGSLIETIPEILASIDIEEGVILDGELYLHGKMLNQIGSLIKRYQEGTKQLVYHCYDVMLAVEYELRYKFISALPQNERFIIAPTWANISESDIPQLLDDSIAAGYEGLILRQPDYSYEDNKRSKGLVKIKRFDDDEFEIVGINQSRDGWAILVCVTKDGNKFEASAPGTFTEKYHVWNNKEKYIGRKVTIKYPNYTEYGIPFQPIATGFLDPV